MKRKRTCSRAQEISSFELVVIAGQHFRVRSVKRGQGGWSVLLFCWGDSNPFHIEHFSSERLAAEPSCRTREGVLEVLKPVVSAKLDESASGRIDSSFIKEYPSIWEFLSVNAYEDGSPRERGWFTVRYEPAKGLTACVKEPSALTVMWLTAPTWERLLNDLEAVLSTGTGDWQVDKYATPKPKKAGKLSGQKGG